MRTAGSIFVLTTLLAAIVAVRAIDAADAAGSKPAATEKLDPAGVEYFEKHIRPLLAENCYGCHSAKAIVLRGKLRLDSREGVLKGGAGGAVIVPGEPEKSRLIQAVRWTDPKFQMPPKKPLSREQIERLEAWVKLGAPDPRDAAAVAAAAAKPISAEEARRALWSLRPIERPEVPADPRPQASGAREEAAKATNPIDAFLAAEQRAAGLTPVGRASKRALLRRVHLDLTGIPPTPAEQAAFAADESPGAYEKVVDRLLASEQHGVRYARRWLDVLRYADLDERMLAAPGIHLWRDWMIRALNEDLPYDQFVRTQLTGYRTPVRTQMSSIGYRSKAEPRADDLFALGLLARGAVIRDTKIAGELAISAVETVSSAFMGMTVACAKCHDHVYDPITQRDYYAMKALFDPLVPRRITLATADDLVASGRAAQEAADRRAPLEAAVEKFVAPIKQKLYDDRVAMLPLGVQPVIRKPERDRTAAEQKIADDYFPILRIDGDKISEALSDADRKTYQELLKKLSDAAPSGGGGRRGSLAAVWTVEVDPKKEQEKSYILTSGDPERPELDREVSAGWPFGPSQPDIRDGRVEAFSDWLTAADNPLLARVAVNRLWQWHFGEGLHRTPSDFGKLGGEPTNPKLLDWLASEFVRQKFSMKTMHRLIVTSEAYQRATEADAALAAANGKLDPDNVRLWKFPLERLDAEAIWDSIFAAAGMLDVAVGGSSFSVGEGNPRRGERRDGPRRADGPAATYRRAAYMQRGFSTSRDVMPAFLQAFDVDDGRVPCPQRTQTVTASQGLFLMNSDDVERATAKLAERLQKESGGNLPAAVDLGYRVTLGRTPSAKESERALAYVDGDAARLKGFAWLLFNLDEFIYVR